MACGFGVYQHVNGSKYEGNWLNDKQNGQGIEHWKDGARYQGEFVNGMKEGLGILEFADGSRYEGIYFFFIFLLFVITLFFI